MCAVMKNVEAQAYSLPLSLDLVLACKKKVDARKKEKMLRLAEIKADKARARREAEEFLKFKKAFGLYRRRKASRYSARK